MYRRSWIAALATLALASGAGVLGSGAAVAQSSGPYVLGGAGVSLLEDSDTRGGGFSGTQEFDPGWSGLGAVGYAFANGFRLEGELGYRRNEVENGPGNTEAWSLMGNALYDFHTGTKFTPYVGVGLGGTRLNFSNVAAGGTTIDDGDTVVAYQGLAGVTYDLVTNLKLDLGYRYFTTERPSFRTSAGGTAEGDYDDHTLMLGLRYQFNGP